jgi:hypothetical protein
MENHHHAAAVKWTSQDVAAMLASYPHITAMEAARRSGWTVWAIKREFGRV